MNEPSHNPDCTEDLFQRAQGGDVEAFGQLFGDCTGRLLLYIRLRMSKQLAAKTEAQDILQETALAAFKDIGRLEPRGRAAFARWLCAIAENRIRDARDFHGAQKRVAPGERESFTLVLDKLRDSGTGPFTAVQRHERHENLERELQALPEQERQALVLRHFGGATLPHIARELGKSESATRRLLARATASLGEGLGGGSA